ncbi:hypothetical protein NP233_g421 [Leucocoprinus birnbaumii]|uniref:alanine--glyoxylate transaminase n=1 Tax=Leucocoprinus birnbaumii TaxID=56174 RepID=A0AAD5YWQ5_9AGAR|nr:hypothetical protein NP233_g421 [Leucocoprinus birnbaumii]
MVVAIRLSSSFRSLFSLRSLPPAHRFTRPFTMTTKDEFKQQPHKLLVIPGPIEVADEVLFANAHPSMSHVSPEFVPVFGDCIRMTREVLLTKSAQPFLISGSGTLGWDQVAANLIEQGENVLILHSGYFGDSFTECLETYGANAKQLKAPIGRAVALSELEKELKGGKKYKMVTVTHVDTSTGVLSNVKEIAALVRRISPDTLVAVDAVCSVASEEIKFDDWDLDIVLTASQKGLGTPPGLSILVASQRALGVFKSRKSPPTSYYASWKKWLPIMNAYESGKPAYFATPPVNLMYAYHASLKLIVKGETSLQQRLQMHRDASKAVKDAAKRLGLKQLPEVDEEAANGMTALYFPEGLGASDIIPRLNARNVVVAGGLHVEIKDKYFRIGHMGLSVVDAQRGDVNTIIKALEETLKEARAANTSIPTPRFRLLYFCPLIFDSSLIDGCITTGRHFRITPCPRDYSTQEEGIRVPGLTTSTTPLYLPTGLWLSGMDLNWCLNCGKQVDDDNPYCSLECQQYDSPSNYERRPVATSSHSHKRLLPPLLKRPVLSDFKSNHDDCLSCGVQVRDDDGPYCSLECRQSNNPPAYEHFSVATSSRPTLDFESIRACATSQGSDDVDGSCHRPKLGEWSRHSHKRSQPAPPNRPILGFESIHDWVAKVSAATSWPENRPREVIPVYVNHASEPQTTGAISSERSSPPVLIRAPRLVKSSSIASPSVTKPELGPVNVSASDPSSSTEQLLSEILRSQPPETSSIKTSTGLPLPAPKPPPNALAIRRLRDNRSVDGHRPPVRSFHSNQGTGSLQGESWTPSSHTLSHTNTRSTSSTLVDPVWSISEGTLSKTKIIPEMPENQLVNSTARTLHDHSVPLSGSNGFFSHSHHIVMPNASMYSIENQHYHSHHSGGHIDVLERMMKYTLHGAGVDSNLRDYPPRCYPGTRTNVLSSVRRFIQEDVKIIHISGPAGAGKSAIMQTFAEEDTKDNLRVALFMSKKENVNDARRIFSTIAYQLALQNEYYQKYLEAKFKADPLFMEKSLLAQFQSLVATPFIQKHVPLGAKRCIILIDALDDCQEERDQCQVLHLVHDFILNHSSFPIVWIFATRSRAHITSFFSQVKRRSRSFRELYLSIGSERARRDVNCYLESEFRKIKDKFPERIPPSICWPTKSQFSSVSKASSGFFAFATAIIQFINQPSADPVSRLSDFLEGGSRSKLSSENLSRPLDSMYSQIMADLPDDTLAQIKSLLGFYLSPLSIILEQTSLLLTCNLLGLDHSLDCSMQLLLPIITLPPAPLMHTRGLQFLHSSSIDFLRDSKRSGAYWVDIEAVITEVWKRCTCILLQWSEFQSSEAIQITWTPDSDTPVESARKLREEIFYKAGYLWVDLLYRYCHRWCSSHCITKLEAPHRLMLDVSDILNMLQQIDYRRPAVFGESPTLMAKFCSWLLRHAPVELRNQLVLQEFHLMELNRPRFFKALCEWHWFYGITESEHQRFKIENNATGLAALQDLPPTEWFIAEAALVDVCGSLGDLVQKLQPGGLRHSSDSDWVTVLGTDPTNCWGLIQHENSPLLFKYDIFPYSDTVLYPASIPTCSLD